MKGVYKNWRCDLLIVLGIVAFMMAIAESDSLLTLALSKVLSIACCLACYHLGKKWGSEGKIDELKNLND